MTRPATKQPSFTVMNPSHTPNESSITNMHPDSIDLSEAIVDHHHYDIDQIPKLIVQHTKTYPNKSITTFGQVFPTWHRIPDYQCIHCFGCDRLFAPIKFMLHVDDEQMKDIRPIYITPIQLLKSERLSADKIYL